MTDFNLMEKFSVNPKATGSKTDYSEEEQARLLVDYEPIDPNNLKLLVPGDAVRYTTKDGKFKIGGKVHNINFNAPVPVMFLHVGYGPSYFKWSVQQDNILKLWRKKASTVQPEQKVDQKNEQLVADLHSDLKIQNLQLQIDQLKLSVQSLQADNQKLIQAIAQVFSKTRGIQPTTPNTLVGKLN
jgi:hypothetical protein